MGKIKLYTVLSVITLFDITVNAQLTLPYYTGFDTPAEQAGWQQYTLGVNGTYGPWKFFTGGFSAPKSLYHDYNNTGTVEDWYVSPPLNFTAPGQLTLKIKIITMIGIVSPDYFGIWYSAGGQNPTSSNFTEVANFTNLPSGAQWIDTTITLPFTAGTGYIGLKYKNGNNWFTVNVDNINVKNIATGITELEAENDILVYPNPLKAFGIVDINPKMNIQGVKLHIYDTFGKTVKQLAVNEHKTSFEKNNLPSGLYFYELVNNYQVLKTGKIMVE